MPWENKKIKKQDVYHILLNLFSIILKIACMLVMEVFIIIVINTALEEDATL